MRKGFIHVLEAGISVLILISTIIYISPEIREWHKDESYRFFYFFENIKKDDVFKDYVYNNNVSGIYEYIDDKISMYTSASEKYVEIKEKCYYKYNGNVSFGVDINGSDSIYVSTYFNESFDVEDLKVYEGSSGYEDGEYTRVSYNVGSSAVNIDVNSTRYPYKVYVLKKYGYGDVIEGDVYVYSSFFESGKEGCFKELKIKYSY